MRGGCGVAGGARHTVRRVEFQSFARFEVPITREGGRWKLAGTPLSRALRSRLHPIASRNICRHKFRAGVRIDAHNGRHLLRPALRNRRCAKLRRAKKRKAAKRSAQQRSKRPAG